MVDYQYTMRKHYRLYHRQLPHLLVLYLMTCLGAFLPSGCQSVDDIEIEKSLAILPFTGSSTVELQKVNDVLLNDVWSHVSQIPDLLVISPSSSGKYRNAEVPLATIGQELGVKYIIKGETKIHDNLLNLNIELLRTEPLHKIWEKQYQHSLETIDQLAHDLAFQVAKQLRSRFDKRIQVQSESILTHHLSVKEKYLVARKRVDLRTRESLNRAILLLEEVVSEDPNFASAHSLMAEAYSVKVIFGYGDFDVNRTRALIAALKAIEIDPLQGAAHAVVAASAAVAGDYDGAHTAYTSAFQVSPNNPLVVRWYADFVGMFGDQDYGFALAERAYKLDPFSPMSFFIYLESSWPLNKPELSQGILEKMVEQFPDAWITQIAIADHAAYHGAYEKCIEYYEKALLIEPEYHYSYGYMGYCYGRLGQMQEALEMRDKLLASGTNHYALANVYSGMGEIDQAFRQLSLQMETSLKLDVVEFLQSVWSDPLKSDPRYKALRKELKIDK